MLIMCNEIVAHTWYGVAKSSAETWAMSHVTHREVENLMLDR